MKKSYGVRLLTVFLCLLLALFVFAACDNGKDPSKTDESSSEDSTSGEESSTGASETETITVSQYSLYVSDNASSSVASSANTLVSALQNKTGSDLAYYGTDYVSNIASIDANAYEILVGSTNREESLASLTKLNGLVGYVIEKAGNKIVINASNDKLLDEAVQYFIESYLGTAANGTFELPKDVCYVNDQVGGVALLGTDGEPAFTFIYSSSVDDTNNGTGTGADKDRYDYVMTYYVDCRSQIYKAMGALLDITNDLGTSNSTACEILLGRTNREETNTFLQNLAINEYGYGVVGNKIVITGWSDYTIGLAVDLFMEDFSSYLCDNGTGENFILLETDNKVVAYEKWNVSIPLYQGGELYGVVEELNDAYEAYYTNTTLEEYNAYRATLVSEGYSLYQENQIGGNYYATYRTAKTMIHVYYTAYDSSVRLITESMTTVRLPQNTDPYTKICDTTMTLVDLDTADGNFGNCFIITLEDGSFIVHDGGGDSGDDLEEMWTVMNRLNQREDGIVVAAWIISHEHWDHFKNFYDLIAKYYSKGLSLEKVVYNVSVDSFDYNTGNPGSYVQGGYLAKVVAWTGCELVRMHSGQTIQIRNLKIEVLYTWEDIYPAAPHHFNNTAFVTRFDIGEGADKQRLTIVGDIEDVGSKILCKMYEDELKTDIVQVAHHGWGGTVELYKYFKPTIVFWPGTQSTVDSSLKTSNTGYYPTIYQSLMNQTNVKLLIVADNGHKIFPLPLTGVKNTHYATTNDSIIVWERECD